MCVCHALESVDELENPREVLSGVFDELVARVILVMLKNDLIRPAQDSSAHVAACDNGYPQLVACS